MSTYTLRTVNANNDIIAEDELILEPNDVLVLQIPENISLESAKRIHEKALRDLQSDDLRIITLLNGVGLKVLKIQN